ncbi:MAG: FAD-dependent oxidoreductase [Chloroflexota bacterium]
MLFDRSSDVIVVGAGLSGLTAAVRLAETGLKVTILEARDRIGGRIYSAPLPGTPHRFDLGPAWFWPHQEEIIDLLQRLNIPHFEQYETGDHLFERGPGSQPERFLPQGRSPHSYRIEGGTYAIVDALASQLPANTIQFNHIVKEIIAEKNGSLSLTVHTAEGEIAWRANHVVVTLPPQLANKTITYAPSLPADLSRVMTETPTWMGEAMKVSLVYPTPFWRKSGLSGMAISYAGPVQQFHDATPASGEVGALFGWLGNYSFGRRLSIANRREAVIEQVVRLFGKLAMYPTHYAETNWEQEPFTTVQNDGNRVTAQAHPRYGHPLLLTPQMDGRLWWATTEASPREGGYLDGAIFIGKMVAAQIARIQV